MGEPAKAFLEEQRNIDRRIDCLLAAHNGDLRATAETLLILYDHACDRLSSGFTRGQIKSHGQQ